MDYSREEYFVNQFIDKNRRDRILHELSTPEKRRKGLDRFSHPSKDLFRKERIVRSTGFADEEERDEFIQAHPEECTVFSFNSSIDRQTMPLEQALVYAENSMEAFIIIGLDYVLVYGEPEKGGREEYLLAEK